MNPSPGRALSIFALLCVVLLAGCARRDAVSDGAALQARAQSLIDAGNAFYSAQDYTSAAKRYGAAVVVKPDDPAAYFGLGMALTKLGRDEEARQAYARARELAQQAQQARGAGEDTARRKPRPSGISAQPLRVASKRASASP
jgi:tetratricopeptide (TPR) repeat protein